MEINITKTQAEGRDVMDAFYNTIYKQITMSTSAEQTYQLAEAWRAISPYPQR